MVDDGALKIKLTSAEFLSGLRLGDKLMPIITAVMYFGEEPWDGPRSLYDLLDIKDESLKKFIPNYWINLISPVDMDEDEFEKFHTELGYAMRVLKHQKEDVDEVILATNHRKVSPETAYFLNSVAKLNLEFVEEAGGVDMCKSLEKRMQKEKIIEAIEIYREYGESDEDIINKIMSKFKVAREYILTLLEPQKV